MKASHRIRSLCAALLCVTATLAVGQSSKNLSMIVPYPAGGASDGAARAVAPPLGAKLGQQVIVENLGGVGGGIAAQKVLNAPADGNSLFFGSPNEIILAPEVNAAIKYKAEDFTLIHPSGFAPLVLLARKDLPANTVDEFVALARKASAEGKPLNYGSVGIGSTYHLLADSFGQRIGAKLNHVPYKGGTPLIQDLAGGQVDFAFLAYQSSMGALAEQGRLKILASLGKTRPETLKQYPTVNESKEVKNFDFTIWGGYFVKKGTPPEVTQRLNKAIAAASGDPAVIAYRETQGSIRAPEMSLQEAAKFFEAETAAYRKLVKAVGVTPQ